MKNAAVYTLVALAGTAALASPAPGHSSLGLTQQHSHSAEAVMVATRSSTEQSTPAEVRQVGLSIAADPAPEDPSPGPSSLVETVLVMLAAGVVALLALARRRVPR